MLTSLSIQDDWYKSLVLEIFDNLSIELVDSKLLDIENIDTVVLDFSLDFCNKLYDILIKNNDPNDIKIHLIALKLAAYHPNFILENILRCDPEFLLKRPLLSILFYSRYNLYRYPILRENYERNITR
ncbi:MAG: hypothetical protein ACRCRU_00485 [Vibrio sp.]|uniref:hypothetical protein n=1 Tax=Vibrio TaxID=662 RepID=UPI0014073607|nr:MULTISPECIES: hypothetical protein [unclassified Vibrio]QIL85673.1 hypothetical protein G7083_07280 [Vibrio sp. HDW18]